MYPSENWKLFFTLSDLIRRDVALRLVCQKCRHRTDMQPHGIAYWREPNFKGRDVTVAQFEKKLTCPAKHRNTVVMALESWERIGR